MNESCKICGGHLSPFIKNIFDDRHGYPGRFDVLRCETCGFGQTVPEIPEDKIGEVYTNYYPRKNIIDIEAIKSQPLSIMSPLKRWWMGVNNTAHYHIRSGTRVLDVGCGDCASIREINAMGSEGYGIEPDQNVRPVVEALGLKVHIGLFHDIPYPDNYFDYITMSQVLEHIHDPIELLKSFRRILKDDGQIIIGVPNVDSRLRKKYGSRWLNWHVPYHINHFSGKSLNLLAEKSGYKVTGVRTYTPNLWVDLQKRLASYSVREGIRVPFFNGEDDSTHETGSPGTTSMHIAKELFRSLLRRLNLLNILFLRLIDAAGSGESYLVFLKKN